MNFSGFAGGFAEGASDGVRTALDFVDRRERRALQQEDMANKREDRRLAMEDRGRRLQDEEQNRRVATMRETLTTDAFNEAQRKTRLDNTIRSELKTRFADQNGAREAWVRGDDVNQPPAGFLTNTPAPQPKGTLAMYDDMLDNPPEEWRNDPEYGTAVSELRKAAEKEGLGQLYLADKRGASIQEKGKIFNRYGDIYGVSFKSGKDFSDEDIKAMGQDPADKKNIFIAIDDKGRHLPLHLPSVGKFLGLEKESKWVKGPDNSGVVYDESDPRRYHVFPDQQKPPTPEDAAKITEANTKQWNEYVGRAATVLKNGYFAGGEIQFDTDRGKKYTQANGLAQTWLANGMSNPDGLPLQPERIAELAKGVADGDYTVDEVNKTFKFAGRPALGVVPATPQQPRAAAVPQPGGATSTLPAKTLVVQGDAKPTAPPSGAPTDGNWRRTEQGWIYVDKSGKNAWEADAPPAPAAAPAAAPKPAPTPAAAAPAVDPVAQARTLDAQIAQLKSTLAGSTGMDANARRSAQAKLAEMETARSKLGVGPAEMQQADKARLAQELASAQEQLAQLEAAPKDYRNHSAMSALQDLRAKVAALKKAAAAGQGGATSPQTRGLSAPATQRPPAGNNGATGSWGSPEPAKPSAMERAAPQMEAPRNEFERAAAAQSLKIPASPANGKGFTTAKTGDTEVYNFASGEKGFFLPSPTGKGVLFQRIDGSGKPSGTPVGVVSKEYWIKNNSTSKGRR